MELSNADVVCFKCGKRGHVMARCYARVSSGAKMPSKKTPFPKGASKNQRARRMSSAPTTEGSKKCGNAVGMGCSTDADSEATPKFRVVEQMGSIVPEVSRFRTSILLVYSARVRGYDQVMILVVGSGASQNFVKLVALSKKPAMFEPLC